MFLHVPMTYDAILTLYFLFAALSSSIYEAMTLQFLSASSNCASSSRWISSDVARQSQKKSH